ncbi:solute carrier family 41 member 1 [Cephus cinctus]|uniref:Solute carrier family 41 member 1 n=1 Tax=Cephus cinctus TaxID=211228 RepID=A0AAJ7FN53_CEPCN|nr:solute carrier family 41 member 1 [Cephus cinctus]XP_015600057.1 solute carrier family 41 member 1 [Cephus cinctus]XP_015600058.1 solute carrier family 41 member 1 [Cephus cinctus]XP_024943195.1 solute carrier family 41 member 1 [Cephus cinctus]
MVAFPPSENEPTLLNFTGKERDGELKGEVVKVDELLTTNKGEVNSLTAPRVTMAVDKDSLALTFNNESEKIVEFGDKMKSVMPDDQLKSEHIIVKKVAALLKSSSNNNEKKEPIKQSPGGGSLSSGSSIVTIASVTNSDPDPEFPNGHNHQRGRRRSVVEEKWYHTTLQVAVPFFIAGIGTIGAGLILEEVQRWPVFVAISELFILVPALLGLKGNLDMCLASRLSTQANLGNMSSCREIVKMIVGNVALVQIQAIVAAILVSLFAVSVGAVMKGSFVWNNALLLAAASVCTATSSCFILDFVMIAVILVSHQCKWNPDNLATPLAASVGDAVSITVLSTIASALYLYLDNQIWILYIVLTGYILLLPVWICVVLRNKYTRNVLTSGWTPVLSALFISGLGGLILDQAVNVFDGFVIFQPIINGIGGNLVSVQASRISTVLHQTSLMGILPPHSKMWVSPWTALFNGVPYAKTARILICMSVPGHLVFTFAADYINWGYSTLHVYFVVSYVTVAVFQVTLLLYIAHIIIHGMWKYKIDPDNSAIPYLTALGDLLGSMFLAAAFWFLQQINQEYGDY